MITRALFAAVALTVLAGAAPTALPEEVVGIFSGQRSTSHVGLHCSTDVTFRFWLTIDGRGGSSWESHTVVTGECDEGEFVPTSCWQAGDGQVVDGSAKRGFALKLELLSTSSIPPPSSMIDASRWRCGNMFLDLPKNADTTGCTLVGPPSRSHSYAISQASSIGCAYSQPFPDMAVKVKTRKSGLRLTSGRKSLSMVKAR